MWPYNLKAGRAHVFGTSGTRVANLQGNAVTGKGIGVKAAVV